MANGPNTSASPPFVIVPVIDNAADRELFVVAHQDDDLLFANPDLGRTLQGNGSLAIVYLTGGDDGRGADYYLERERGVEEAYATLLSLSKPRWINSTFSTGGHDIARSDLSGSALTLFFLRLPDGNGDGNGFGSSRGTPFGSLAKLWDGRLESLRVLDSTESYSRRELLDALSAIGAAVNPTRVATLDVATANGFDHSDHHHAALFTQDALSSVTPLRFYRGYSVVKEVPNIDGEEAAAKWSAFLAYAAHDSNICHAGTCDAKILGAYSAYPSRQYLSSRSGSLRGEIASASGLCLDATNVLRATVCGAAFASRTFVLQPNGELAGQGGCVVSTLGAVSMSSCSGASGTTLDESHRWSLLSSGNLVSSGGLCLRAPLQSNDPVDLAPCTTDPRNLWGALFQPERSVIGPTIDLTSAPLLFGSLDEGSIGDFCARTHDGIRCWIRNSRSITVTDAAGVFSDADGWSQSTARDSFRLVDVDLDGFGDICAVKDDGAYCAFGEGGGRFIAPTLMSREFTQTVRSSAFGDVDGDKRPDLCAIVGSDLRCALSVGRSFSPSEVWLRGIDTSVAARLVLTDVSRDGRADACEVTKDDVDCAVTRAGHLGFVRQRTWAMRDPATTLAFTTLQFADIDGDGDDDACGVSSTGIECAKSSGSSFGAFLLTVQRPARDVSWADRFILLKDTVSHAADACRWGQFGVACSAAP